MSGAILIRCCKQLCGKRLALNLSKATPYLNTRFMSRAISDNEDIYTWVKKGTDDLDFSSEKNKNRSAANEDFDENKDSEKGDFSNYSISEEAVKKLKDASINHLFAVQYGTFSHIQDGKDAIVQARTGTGKTLAFVLPILEKLREVEDEVCVGRGRSPQVLTLAPTRELAVQTYKQFEKFKSKKVSVSCFYGGSPYFKQEEDLHNGIDILVGTPGRIIDHMEKGSLDFSNLKHVILDEADRMMDMGFQEDLDRILLNSYTKHNKPQMLLFSATVPSWVKQTAKKYTSTDMKRYDFIGTEVKSAILVEHKALMCSYQDRAAIIKDIVQVHSGKHGKTIIFTATKQEANELALNSVLNMDSQVLHGDIQQNHRELTLEGFRNGKFNCLIATDVAARGLDIPEIDLVIQTEPPNDVDSYIHRSGRTGRAGRNGVSIIFFQKGEEDGLQRVEKRAGVSFTRIGAPRREELIVSSANDAAKSLGEVKADLIDHFIPFAKCLIERRGAENELAAALALISGATEIAPRSLLTSQKGYTSYICKQDSELYSTGPIWKILNQEFDESFTRSIVGMVMCKDRKGCVFDVPTDKVKEIEENWNENEYVTLEKLKYLPELSEVVQSTEKKLQKSYNQSDYKFNKRGGGYNQSDNKFNKSGGGYRPPIRQNDYYNSNQHYNNSRDYFSNRSSNFNRKYDDGESNMDYRQNNNFSKKSDYRTSNFNKRDNGWNSNFNSKSYDDGSNLKSKDYWRSDQGDKFDKSRSKYGKKLYDNYKSGNTDLFYDPDEDKY